MMRSMFSGVSGLRVHQTKMDVIANNISNVNTAGFKSSRVTFAEIFAQTVNGASAANDQTGRGGVNPMQIGLGATVASIDLSTTQGAAQRTDNPYDLMVQGDGFFIVGDESGSYFTRAGAFTLDAAGNLVNPAGMRVMGWDRGNLDPVTGNYNIVKSNVKPIEIKGAKWQAPPETTKHIAFEGNLNAVEDGKDGVTRNIAFYDSLGNRWITTMDFKLTATQPTGGTSWDYTFSSEAYLDGQENVKYACTAPTAGTIIFNANGNIASMTGGTAATPPATAPDCRANFTFLVTTLVGGGASNLPAADINTAPGISIEINFNDLTQYAEKTDAKANTVDGLASGDLMNVSIGTDGKVTGLYTNGKTFTLAQIAVARFRNAAGLEKIGDNLYTTSPNSGDFDGIGEEAQESGGKIMGGVLEMSNVDLSQEFTEMITTQRGFQANSRIITTSDDMLQELVNLKR